MFQSLILRRIQRTMTTRTLRRILLIILPMEEMTAMMRRKVARLLAISSPPASPLFPWSLPPPQIPFPPLPPILSPPLPILSPAPPPSPIQREVGYGITDSWDEIVELLQGAPEIYRDFRVEDSPTGISHSPTGTADSFASTGYHFTKIARPCWRSYTVGVTRGGWWQCID
nr:hypothetical protein [Tanacetum cinerariifolium]